jgi:hypothetical protein
MRFEAYSSAMESDESFELTIWTRETNISKHSLYEILFRRDNQDKISAEEQVFLENEESRYSRLSPES